MDSCGCKVLELGNFGDLFINNKQEGLFGNELFIAQN